MNFIHRSWLCLPTLKSNLHEIILSLNPDILHLDLEDSILESRKQEARDVIRALDLKKYHKPFAVRINALSSSHGLDDLQFIKKYKPNIDILILPKVECNRDVEIVGDNLSAHYNNLKIFAVIESLKGLKNIENICTNGRHLSGLIFGAADMFCEIGSGMYRNNKSLDFIRYEIAKAAHATKLVAIDSPCFKLANQDSLKSELDYAKELGYSGKIAIHPNQVDMINSVFEYSKEEIEIANSIANEIDFNIAAVQKINGYMVGPPFRKMAKKILETSNET